MMNKIDINLVYLPNFVQELKRENMLGEKLKELRESNGFVQRQVAAALGVDTAYVSKMENNDKPVSRAKLKSLAQFYRIKETTLLPFWLAEKVLSVVNDEDCATDALKIVLNEIDKK
jgi:transcriptional regulator with XRE-family HTH domain